MEAIKEATWSMEFVELEYYNKKKEDYPALKFASSQLRNDYDIVLSAVKYNGLALEYASKELRNNLDIVLEAIKQKGLK